MQTTSITKGLKFLDKANPKMSTINKITRRAAAGKAVNQFTIDANELLEFINTQVYDMSYRQLKFINIIVLISSAYAELMMDKVQLYIDVKTRINWLVPFMYDPTYEDPKNDYQYMNVAQRYRQKMKPLFQLSTNELICLEASEVTTFLIMHAQDGII